MILDCCEVRALGKLFDMRTVVIGTGLGSIASALRLRSLGHEIDILETCPDPGGRARSFIFDDQVFDAGPTVITAPWLFDELFDLFGEARQDWIEFLPCDPWYRLMFADGSSMDLASSIEQQEQEIAKLSPKDAARYRGFLNHCQELYRVGYEELGDADFSKFSSMIRLLPRLFALGGLSTLWRHTGRFFEDRRVRQAFSLPTLLIGGNPLTTSSIYGLIHAMERKGGIWFARGGTSTLVAQLVALCQRHGIRFHYNHKVQGFSLDASGYIRAVHALHGDRNVVVQCDSVVWGGDPQGLYAALGDHNLSLIERIRRRTVASSMGLYVMYFKTNRNYPDVAHHTIVLSERWEGLLRDIFKGRNLPRDPSLYLHRPAATDPSFKLLNGEIFYVLAPVPHLGNYNSWQVEHELFKNTVVSILENRVLPDLSSTLSFGESIDPRYFRDTLLSNQGSGFSIAPLLRQSAWFRFHNHMDKVSNLYLCGAGVHPGGGLPGVITSAKVVERLVRRDFSFIAHPSKTEKLEPLFTEHAV